MKSETCFFLRSLQRKGLIRGTASRDGVSVHLLNENRTRLIRSGGLPLTIRLSEGFIILVRPGWTVIDSVQLKQRWDRWWERERGSVTLSGAINIENGKQGCRTAHRHNYAHTPTCAHREQKTNTNHECKALAVTDVGRELGGKRNTFISFCASFGFMVRMLRGKRWEERALACLSHGTLGSSRSIWWLLCLLLLYPQI